MKNIFFRLGVTMTLTREEFDLICTSSDAAHNFLRNKVPGRSSNWTGRPILQPTLIPAKTNFTTRMTSNLNFSGDQNG